jgi:hypothetical protein
MGTTLETGVADFTRLTEQVEGAFACVLACDNAVAHLHADADLARFAAGMRAKLEPGGLALVSLRDYAPLVSERAPGHPVRVGPGTISFQVWEWDERPQLRADQFTRAAGRTLEDGLPPHPLRAAAPRICGALPPGRGRALAHPRDRPYQPIMRRG